MGEFLIRDAEPGSYKNENGTVVDQDVTETLDTVVEGDEFVVRWFRLQIAFDGRGERHFDETAGSVELLRVDREQAVWLRDELAAWLS